MNGVDTSRLFPVPISRRYLVDTAKAQAGLGYEPLHSFPQGIRRTVA